MTSSVTRPSNYAVPFASGGAKNTIPVAASPTAGLASFATGFPSVTMKPLTAGGIPPSGLDFNGILYDITTHTVFVNAGGQYRFDSALVAAIGGYPAGIVLQSNDGLNSYLNVLDGNSADFNANPSSIGVSWMLYAGTSLQNSINSVSQQSTGSANAALYQLGYLL